MAGKTNKTVAKRAVQGEVISAPGKNRAEQIDEVIRLMGEGWSENRACLEVGINRNTFRAAALRHEAADTYARALETLAHEQIQQVEQTIQDMRSGVVDPMMAKVEIDTRKWFASKFLPKQYGDKVDLTTNGKDLPSPLLGGVSVPSSNSDT